MSTLEQSTNTLQVAQRKLRGEVLVNVQPRQLQLAIYQTIHGRRGDSKIIADALGIKPNAVLELADPLRRVPLKVHQVVPMVRATNCYAIPDLIDQELGRVAFSLPSVNPHAEEMNRELARDVTAFGEFLRENGMALEDGVIEPHEVKPLLGAIDSMIAGLSRYRALVLAKARVDAPVAVAR